MDMYAETILEHYRHPHNHGKLSTSNAERRESNPLCGDSVAMYLLIEKDKIKDVRFLGQGCAISQSATSLLTDAIKGKSIEEVKKLDKDYALDLLGVEISPGRMKCALLGIKTLKLALYDYMISQKRKTNEMEFEVKDS